MSDGEYYLLAAALLGGYIAAWWLAVRITFGAALGVLDWLIVLFFAFGVPLMLIDLAAMWRTGWQESRLVGAWFGVAATIDVPWAVSRLYRWLKRGASP